MDAIESARNELEELIFLYKDQIEVAKRVKDDYSLACFVDMFTKIDNVLTHLNVLEKERQMLPWP